MAELVSRDALRGIFFVGYSMGGNLVLKMAGELAAQAPPQLCGVCAVNPGLDLAACADAIALPQNFVYEWNFLHGLKSRVGRKARLFPGRYPVDGLGGVHTLREFDEVITAPAFGFRDADDYYYRSSALRVVGAIGVPALILIAQDDPFVPFASFRDPAIAGNPQITLVAPPQGGHCAFISCFGGEERFWAEARVVEFCCEHSALGEL
jgi:predicted alpha/beta-fold hydrolase